MKRWTSPSKQQEALPETTKTKYEINLEQMKRKVETSALERDDFVLQKHLKSLMYIDCSLRVYPKKDKLINEFNFKNCRRSNRKTTSKFFVGVYYKERRFIICAEYFDANNIFSNPFIQNLRHEPNRVQDL